MQAPRGKQLKIHGNIVNVPTDLTSSHYVATATLPDRNNQVPKWDPALLIFS